MEFLLRTNLGHYTLKSHRNGGEFGLLFEAVDSRTEHEVAIKVLMPGSDGYNVLGFEAEGRLLRKLAKASNVVNVIESAEENVLIHAPTNLALPFKYHVLELASGSLDELVLDDASRRALPWIEKLEIWRGAVKGIHQMHLKGCVHRDIKSSNCLLFARQHNKICCKIADLGRSRDLAEPPRLPPEAYQSGRGDFRFAAPECLYMQAGNDGKAFRLEDLYGLGSLLYEISTGQGITSVALGYGPMVFHESLQDYRMGRFTDLTGLRSQFNRAIALLEPEVPAIIRDRAVSLVRQLCAPVPGERLPLAAPGKRTTNEPGLTWLLRQADIMIKSLSAPVQNRGWARARRGR